MAAPATAPRAPRPARASAGTHGTADRHLLALVNTHFTGTPDAFYVATLQAAAFEEQSGNAKLARQLRDLAEKSKREKTLFGDQPLSQHPTQSSAPLRGELADLLVVSRPEGGLDRVVLAKPLRARLERVLREHRAVDELEAHGLHPRRKLLLVGPPGTGKTTTAGVLAAELGLPLYTVRLEGLITKFLGETAQKLRMLFDAMPSMPGVYFYDEFDAIGSKRGATNEVGEMRRVLNSFLQMIEQDRSRNIIAAASNLPEILDRALFRRFDDVLAFGLPTNIQVEAIARTRIGKFATNVDWGIAGDEVAGLSQAEIAAAAHDAAKETVLDGRSRIETSDLVRALNDRKAPRLADSDGAASQAR